MAEKIKVLYDNLSKDGLYTKDYDSFVTQFSDIEKRKVLHTNLNSDGLYTKSFDEFNEQYFSDVKKKAGSDVSSPGSANPSEDLGTLLGAKTLTPEEQQAVDSPVQIGKGIGAPVKADAVANKQNIALPKQDIDSYNKVLQDQAKAFTQEEQAQQAELQKLDNGIGTVRNTVNSVVQGFYALPADAMETIALGGSLIDRKVLGNEEANVQDNPLYQFGQAYRNFIENYAPTNPAMANDIATQVGSSAGQMLSLVATGGAAMTAKATSLTAVEYANIGKTLFKQAVNTVTSPVAIQGAMQMGLPEYKNAIAAGASEDEAFNVFLKNAVVGSALENIPVQSFFSRLDKVSGGTAKKVLAGGFTGGSEEFLTETAQQIYTNLTAQESYDKTREILDGVGESGAIGFGFGFFLNAIGLKIRDKMEKAIDKQVKAELSKAADAVENKINTLEKDKQAFEQSTTLTTEQPNDIQETGTAGTTEQPPIPATENLGATEPVVDTNEQQEPSSGEVSQDLDKANQLVPEPVVQKEESAPLGEISFIDHVENARKGKIENTVTDKSGKIAAYKIRDNKGILYTVPAEKANVSADEVRASGKREYSSLIGASKGQTTRIQPSPIEGIKPKDLKDIILDLNKGLDSKIYYTKKPGNTFTSLGAYSPRSASLGIKLNNDLSTTAHELGHSLDDKFGLFSNIPDDKLPTIEKELMPFSKHGSKPPKGHPEPKLYKLGEGVAEWVRALIVNPEEAYKQAPEFAKWYEQSVSQKMRDTVKSFSDDVRTFYGSSGHNMIAANIGFDPAKQKGGIIEVLKGKKGVDAKHFSFGWQDKVATQMLTSLRPFEKAVQFAMDTKGAKVDYSKNPIILARLLAGYNDKLNNILEQGLVDGKNKRLVDEKTNSPMTLEWLLDPLDKSDEATITNEQKEVVTYMVAERTIELSKKFSKKDLTGIGGGLVMDTEVANKRLSEFEAYDTEKKERIIEAARRYREYSDKILQYMVDKGRLAKEVYNKKGDLVGGYKFIKENNTHYVALNRILEAAPGEEITPFIGGNGKSIGSAKELIKKVKGSTKTIKNPYFSMLDFADKAIKESDRNDVMLSFRELFTEDRSMYQGEAKALSQIARKATEGDANTIKVFVDGKLEHWQLQEDVYKAVKNITDVSFRLPSFVTALPSILRWSVTHAPTFAVRNKMRDVQSRLILSKNTPESGLDIYFDKDLKKKVKNEFELFGGGQGGFYLRDDNFYKQQFDYAVKELAKNKNNILVDPIKLAKKFGSSYNALLEASEVSSRLEEYSAAFKKAKKEGVDDYNASIYAAYQARDLMDFSVAGETMRVVNQVIPFSNAAVQGLRKGIRSAADHPAAFTTRVLLYSVVPALLTRSLVHALDKDEEYQQLPAYQRDMFYNIPVGANHWLTIPKPFELGVIGSGAERMLDKLLFNNDQAFEGYAGSVARTLLPVDESAIAGPGKSAVEISANYDFFRQNTIINPDEEGKDLRLRKTESASRLGQAIQRLVGADARFADHFIKSSASYFGDYALKISDIGREDSKNKLLDLNTTGIFKNSPVYNSLDVQWAIKTSEKYGLHRDRRYKELNKLLGDVFTAKTDEEKEKRGEVVRQYAKGLRKYWEDLDIFVTPSGKTKVKKASKTNLKLKE